MDLSLTTEVTAIFWLFWPILAKIWLSWQRPLDPCNQKCLPWIGRPQKPAVISHHILVICRRNAFICIYSDFRPKIGCHVKDKFPDCTNPISKQLCMDVSLTIEVMAIFVIFWPILAKLWLPWQRPLDRCNQKCLLWIVRPQKPPVVAFSLSLIEMYLYAFIAIFVPKLVAIVTPICPLCTGVSQMNTPMAQTLSQNQTLHGCVAYNWSYGHFSDFFGTILAKIWLPW